MNLDPIYFPILAAVITGILGIGLGSLLSEMRSWLEVRRGNRRVLCLALYHQLELLGQLSLLEKSATDQLLKSFEKYLNRVTQQSHQTLFSDADEISRIISNFSKQSREPEIAQIIEKYDAVLVELAAIDPMLAAQLRPDYHFPFQQKVNAIFGPLTQFAEGTDIERQFMGQLSHWLAENVETRLIAGLKTSIKKLAWKTGWLTWIKARHKLRTFEEDRDARIDEAMREYVEQLLKFTIRNNDAITKERISGKV